MATTNVAKPVARSLASPPPPTVVTWRRMIECGAFMADGSTGSKTRLVINQPYDESVSVHDDEDVASELTPSPRVAPIPLDKTPNAIGKQMNENLIGSDDEFDHDDVAKVPASGSATKVAGQRSRPSLQVTASASKPGIAVNPASVRPAGGRVIQASDDDDDDEEEDQSESSEEDEERVQGAMEGSYDPTDYEHLPVSQEIKELFQYITRYTPQTIELDYKLKPFIPDYIPAVGDIDAFLKVTRPDGKPETLGLQILDEPCAKQSDPTVLDLQLRSISKQTSAKQVVVRSVEDPDKNPKAIDSWIDSIQDLRRQKPAQNVLYTRDMPDIEALMQEWPPEFEEMLKTVNLPSADMDCDLHEYIDIICPILDIPVYKNRIESLHVLFTLYSEFKNSQHFNQLARDSLLANDLKYGIEKVQPSQSVRFS